MATGIFFSKCGDLFDGRLRLDLLAASYENFPIVRVVDDFFNPADFALLLDDVKAHNLDAVVLVGDSHFSYAQTRNGEYLFKCLEEAGVNQNNIEIVNLKNMVALPHPRDHQMLLQQKAKLLTDAAVEKLRHSHPIATVEIAPRKAVAIIGLSSAALVVAQHLLEAGYKVFFLNEKAEIKLPDEEIKSLRPTMVFVERHPRLTMFSTASVTDFNGYPGDFSLTFTAEGRDVEIQVGAAVLSLQSNSAMVKMFQTMFHIDINNDGTLVALDDVTARSQTQDRGIFVINPQKLEGAELGQGFMAADAVASMVIRLLNQKEIHHAVKVSEVKSELCSGCGACVKTCMFHAVTLAGSPLVSHIEPRRCRGCGNCVTACPTDARDLVASPHNALFGAIDIFSQFQSGPKVLLIACEGCGYRCLNNGAESGATWPVGVMPLRVVCGGQIDTRLIIHAFVKGFDGVGLVICGEGCCHNIIGNVDLERRANLLREILGSRGIDEGNMKVIATCSRTGQECIDNVNEFYRQFAGLEQADSTVLLR
ncbi:MAG: hydrogenase iron-sulfur subunit [Desulfuromonadales bacterium]|nr:hydrogenase iron-sulfur subunit [Desulfuromonadales bacterium]